jgi:hypothetical protein
VDEIVNVDGKHLVGHVFEEEVAAVDQTLEFVFFFDVDV